MSEALNLLIGCDPEVFLRNKKTGLFESAGGRFPGTKDKPHKVDKGAIQVDGLALEFNIEPAEDEEEFSNNIETVKAQLLEEVLKVDKDLELVFVPFATFPNDYFKKIPKEYKVLGCDADFSCVNGSKNSSPSIQEIPIRTAAGHVHIGYTENENVTGAEHKEDCRFIANWFHICKTRFYPNTVEEHRRLQHYGFNGAFRPKSYGVELREFSNLWVRTPENQKKMFRMLISGMKKINGE